MLVDIQYKVDHDALYQYLTHFAFPLMLLSIYFDIYYG